LSKLFILPKNIEKYGSGFIRIRKELETYPARILDIPKRTLERWFKRLKDEKKVSFKGAPKIGGYFAT
jgi:hypothetical protein